MFMDFKLLFLFVIMLRLCLSVVWNRCFDLLMVRKRLHMCRKTYVYVFKLLIFINLYGKQTSTYARDETLL